MEIISPGKTTEIKLNKITEIPIEKITQTIELFDFFLILLSNFGFSFSSLLSLDFDFECLPTIRNFSSGICL